MGRIACNKSQRMYRRFNDFVRGELKRKKIKHEELAEYLNLTRPALTLKLNDTTAWSLEQALDTIEFLEADIAEIFK